MKPWIHVTESLNNCSAKKSRSTMLLYPQRAAERHGEMLAMRCACAVQSLCMRAKCSANVRLLFCAKTFSRYHGAVRRPNIILFHAHSLPPERQTTCPPAPIWCRRSNRNEAGACVCRSATPARKQCQRTAAPCVQQWQRRVRWITTGTMRR